MCLLGDQQGWLSWLIWSTSLEDVIDGMCTLHPPPLFCLIKRLLFKRCIFFIFFCTYIFCEWLCNPYSFTQVYHFLGPHLFLKGAAWFRHAPHLQTPKTTGPGLWWRGPCPQQCQQGLHLERYLHIEGMWLGILQEGECMLAPHPFSDQPDCMFR